MGTMAKVVRVLVLLCLHRPAIHMMAMVTCGASNACQHNDFKLELEKFQ